MLATPILLVGSASVLAGARMLWESARCARSRELRRDQRLACGRGVGVGLHHHRRDHGEDGRAQPTRQRVADSGQARHIGAVWIARTQLPPQHVREDRRGEVVPKEV
jgi:hypothetical protein